MQNQAATLFPDYRTFPATSPIRVSPRSRAHDFPIVSRAPMQLIYIGLQVTMQLLNVPPGHDGGGDDDRSA